MNFKMLRKNKKNLVAQLIFHGDAEMGTSEFQIRLLFYC